MSLWRWAQTLGRWLWKPRPYEWSTDARAVMYGYGRRADPALYHSPMHHDKDERETMQ